MKTTVLLCDQAQEVGGKLYILGGGWSQYRGSPVTMTLAVKIAVPWDAANMQHEFLAKLVTEDGGELFARQSPSIDDPFGKAA